MIKIFNEFLEKSNKKELRYFSIVKLLFLYRVSIYISSFFFKIKYRQFTVDSIFWLLGVTTLLGLSLYDEEKVPNIWRILSGAFFYNIAIDALALYMLIERSNAKFGTIIPIPVHYILICLIDLTCVYVLRLNSREFKEKQRCQKSRL